MLWNDKEGDKFFSQPFIDVFKRNELPEHFKKIKATGDDRSRSIFSNLLIEHLIDKLLHYLIKGYGSYLKKTNPSYFNKIQLLKSFELISADILVVADCLREVRNEFAHDLLIQTFEDLPKKRKDKFQNQFLKYSPNPKKVENTIEAKLSQLEFFTIVGLDAYEPNIRLLSTELNSQELKLKLISENKRILNEQFDFIDKFATKKN